MDKHIVGWVVDRKTCNQPLSSITCWDYDIVYVGRHWNHHKISVHRLKLLYICSFHKSIKYKLFYLTEIHYFLVSGMRSEMLYMFLLFMLQIQPTYGQGKSNNYIYSVSRNIVTYNTVNLLITTHIWDCQEWIS